MARKPKSSGKRRERLKEGEASKGKKHHHVSLLLALLVLFLVCLILYRSADSSSKKEQQPSSSRLHQLHQRICERPQTCTDAVHVKGRSMVATQDIPEGMTLFQLSTRSTSIRDIDALRDAVVLEELVLDDDDDDSRSLLEPSTYLAAYLALLLEQRKKGMSVGDDWRNVYLDQLPTLEDYKSFHPVVLMEASSSFLATHLGGEQSYAWQIIEQERLEAKMEYDLFAHRSTLFRNRSITQEDYMVAKLHTLSRAFTMDGDIIDWREGEKEALHARFGPNVATIAMVPILDALDHHGANPSVQWIYEQGRFTVVSDRPIQSGDVLYNFYGDAVDAVLFGHYGFVAGDGSSPIGISLAAFHRAAITDYVETNMTNAMEAYLTYDDDNQAMGEAACPNEDNSSVLSPEELEFQDLKRDILTRIMQDPFYWVVTLPARNPHAVPSVNKQERLPPPRFGATLHLDKTVPWIVSTTCTLLAMRSDDHHGSALHVLRKIIRHLDGNSEASLDDAMNLLEETTTGDDSRVTLALRALSWLRRLTMLQIAKYEVSVEAQWQRLVDWNQTERHTPEWNMAHIQLGELQALHVVQQYAENLLEKGEVHAGDAEALLLADDHGRTCPSLPLNGEENSD